MKHFFPGGMIGCDNQRDRLQRWL